jgi:hypothetical protein
VKTCFYTEIEITLGPPCTHTPGGTALSNGIQHRRFNSLFFVTDQTLDVSPPKFGAIFQVWTNFILIKTDLSETLPKFVF